MGRPKVRYVTTEKKPREFKNGFRVVEMNSHNLPTIKEEYNKEWVSYLDGNGDDYFAALIERYLSSPTNSRCINGISDMIYGRGLEATNSRENPNAYAKMKLLLKHKQVKRIVNDYKLLGQSAAQIIYNKNKTAIVKVLHFPMETLKPEQSTDGEIKAYYYHPNWAEKKPTDEPKRIPSFGHGKKSESIELFIFKPYKAGFYYYAPVDYHGCLQYCDLEEEVSNYHINNIQNGLQPSLMINFNNGIPNEETQELIERKLIDKFSGSSNAGKFFMQFNEDPETRSTIEPIHLPDAHAQYQFLSDEAREKIMLGHGIVSPILLGIKDNTGFGNNAEELRTASIIMDNVVIRPFQQQLIEGFEEILSFNEIMLNLYFVTLQPIEFTELDNIGTKVRREEETGEKLSSQEDFSDEEGDDLISQLEGLGEKIDENDWELIHSEKVDDTNIDFDVTSLASVKRNDAKPSKSSSQDGAGYKVRYAYMPVRKSNESRAFCKAMETFTDDDIVFRKEDINMMSFRGVNKELGHKKRNYSLIKFKGGKNCHHFWELRVYKNKRKVSQEEAIKKGLKEPINPKETPIRPVDMPNKGAYPIKD